MNEVSVSARTVQRCDFRKKVFCWLVMNHIGHSSTFLLGLTFSRYLGKHKVDVSTSFEFRTCLIALANVQNQNEVLTSPLYLPRQLEHVLPGKNIEGFPDKRLMTIQLRNRFRSGYLLAFFALSALCIIVKQGQDSLNGGSSLLPLRKSPTEKKEMF